jgi:hypothetical protein
LGLVENDDEDTPVPGFEEGGPFSEKSIIQQLQAEAQELADAKEVFIPIKGYEGTGLQVKYHLPQHGKELSQIADKVRRQEKDAWERNLNIAIDTMIHLCSGIYVQPGDTPEPVMLDPEDTGVPASFDQRLAEILGIEGHVTSARQVVRRLFGNNDMAIVSHAEKLNRWLANTKADVTLEVWQQGE